MMAPESDPCAGIEEYIVLKVGDNIAYWIDAQEEDRLSARFTEYKRRGGPDDVLELKHPGGQEVLHIPLSDIQTWWLSTKEGRRMVFLHNAANSQEQREFKQEAKALYGWVEDE